MMIPVNISKNRFFREIFYGKLFLFLFRTLEGFNKDNFCNTLY